MNQKEVLRYLGYGNETADVQVTAVIQECWEELERAAVPRFITRDYPLRLCKEYEIDASCFQTHSRNLTGNLKDCSQIILFAATLGSQVDILIQRYNKLQVSKAVILQAAATAMLEDSCDMWNEELKQSYEEKGLYLRPRFSPGYGDFPLECQSALLGALEAGKRIGITLTDSLLMAPSKSITAVIGVSQIPQACTVKGCEVCQKTDCVYRRGESWES